MAARAPERAAVRGRDDRATLHAAEDDPHDRAAATRARAHRRPLDRLRVGRLGLPRVAVPLHAEPSGRRGEHHGRRHGPVHAGAARRWLARRSAGAVAVVARGAAAAAVSRSSAPARRHLRPSASGPRTAACCCTTTARSAIRWPCCCWIPPTASACSWHRTPIRESATTCSSPCSRTSTDRRPRQRRLSPCLGAPDAAPRGWRLSGYPAHAARPLPHPGADADAAVAGHGATTAAPSRGTAAAGSRWRRSSFRLRTAATQLVFRQDGEALAGVMQTWNATYERIGWSQQTAVHLGLVVACLLVFGVHAARVLRTWRRDRDAPAARACALFVALANCRLRRLAGRVDPHARRDDAAAAGAGGAAGDWAWRPLPWRRCFRPSPCSRGANAGGRGPAASTYTLAGRVRRGIRRLAQRRGSSWASTTEPRSPHPRRPRPNGPGAAGSPGRIAMRKVAA